MRIFDRYGAIAWPDAWGEPRFGAMQGNLLIVFADRAYASRIAGPAMVAGRTRGLAVKRLSDALAAELAADFDGVRPLAEMRKIFPAMSWPEKVEPGDDAAHRLDALA
jgi:hypothetical protein